MQWFRNLTARRSAARTLAQNRSRRWRSRLSLHVLEARDVPTIGAITANFNNTAIPAGDVVWFNSVAKMSGLSTSAPTTVHVVDASINFAAGGVAYHIEVP